MKKILVYPKYETNDYNSSNDTNLHADFSQPSNTREKNSEFILHSQSQVDSPKTKQEHDKSNDKKKKKTWKSFVLTWWKKSDTDNNNDDDDDNNKAQMGSTGASNTRRGFTSGPIFSGGKGSDGRPRRPLSGPIMSSLFSPIKKGDSEVPYMCVDQLGRPCVDKNYGPVYLVT